MRADEASGSTVLACVSKNLGDHSASDRQGYPGHLDVAFDVGTCVLVC